MKFNKEKKCPHCGYLYPFDFSFCPNCGKKYPSNKKEKMK